MTLSDEPPANDPESTEVPERLVPEEVPEPAIEDTPERA
jgi:hypothetical protein